MAKEKLVYRHTTKLASHADGSDVYFVEEANIDGNWWIIKTSPRMEDALVDGVTKECFNPAMYGEVILSGQGKISKITRERIRQTGWIPGMPHGMRLTEQGSDFIRM